MDDESGLDVFAAWEREAWEQRAAPYAASLGDLTRGAAPALLDAAGVGAGTRLLDVGTGPGFVALAAVARGAVVTAVDQSAAMVEIALAQGLEVHRAPVESLPFAEGEFEAVVGGFVLNHLARPERAVAEMVRVLRPGGRLALSVWDLPQANPALGLFGPVAQEAGVSAVVPPGPDAARFADEATFRALLGGLADVKVERASWSVTVDPGAWFDAVATSTPRTGAVLAAASEQQRAVMRERYVGAARAHGDATGRVVLPAQAVVGSGTRP
jgi:SAM-dependent methyltransferase